MSGAGPRRPNTVTEITAETKNKRIDLLFCSNASINHGFVIAVVCRMRLSRNSV
jgi:hypothetical protein